MHPAPAPTVAPEPSSGRLPRHLVPFASDLLARLQRAEHVLLFGPRGTGKSTLLAALQAQLRARDVPCATSARTTGLADIVDALARAYPHAVLPGAPRRLLATRLRLAAEQRTGVLLLDNCMQLSAAMIGFLRRLRGGVAAVLLCVETDVPFEHRCARAWRRYALGERMPLLASRELCRRLRALCANLGLPLIQRAELRHLVRSARGRIGWLEQCAHRLDDPAYWNQQQLAATTLCIDIETALRSTPGPKWRARLAGQ